MKCKMLDLIGSGPLYLIGKRSPYTKHIFLNDKRFK